MTVATVNGTGNGTERRAAAERYEASAAAGAPLTGLELGELFGRSERWGRAVIADTRVVEVAAEGPQAPAGSRLDTIVILLVALIAAAASYSHMYNVALLAGEPLWIARAWPITVDGLVIAALRRGEQGRYWLLLGLAVSVASNVLSQYPALVASVAPGVSAWPPLALYGTHRLLHRPG